VKLLHVSDLHIGKRVNGMSLIDDQRFILAQLVELAKGHGAAAILIAGDIYDKASPSAEAVTVFDAFLGDLAEAGVRVLAVPGNHDSAERIAYAQGLLARQGVCFPPVYAGTVESVVLEDEHGPVTFWLLPFLKPGDVRRFFPEHEIGDDYSAALRAVIGACEVDRSARNVVLSHQLVTAGAWSPDRADDEIKLGGIDNVDVSLYDDFDYVALGHVHRPQRVGRDTVRYAGSPLKYSFSEARYDKSAALVELGAKAAGDAAGECVSFELLPLVPLHDMREVRMSLADLLAQGSALGWVGEEDDIGEASETDAAGVDDESGERGSAEGSGGGEAYDYLHVTLTDEHPQLDAMAKVREVFPNTMVLDYDNAALVAHRAQVRAAVDPDKVDTVELFARFYEEQLGVPPDEIQHDIVSKVVRAVESEA